MDSEAVKQELEKRMKETAKKYLEEMVSESIEKKITESIPPQEQQEIEQVVILEEKKVEPIITQENDMSNESQSSTPWGYMATNNGDQIAAQVGLASLTKTDPLTEVAANGVSNLRSDVREAEASIRSDVKDAESSLKDTIHAQSLANGMEFCGINRNVASEGSTTRQHLANAERDLQNRIWEGIRTTERAAADGYRFLSEKHDFLKEKISNFERNTDENFCKIRVEAKDNTQKILDQGAAYKLDEKNDEILKLRTKHSDHLAHSNIALQNLELASLKQMINSVEQNQRFSSKTVQFGAGNVAIPTQTANQG